MKKYFVYAIMLAAAATFGLDAHAVPDEKDLDPSVRLPVRRLHPEREFDKAMKQMHKDHEAKEQAREAKEQEKEAKRLEKEAKKEAKNKNKHDNRVIPPRPAQRQAAASVDKSLMKELLSKDYSLKKFDIYEEPKPITWKDDPVSNDVNGLMSHVSSGRRNGNTFYTPKGVSLANDANDVFFCFESSGNAPGRLHLRVQYYADDPLNYNDITFTIDGFNYNFHPGKPARGKQGARMYWEQSEDALTAKDKDLVYALSHCHWARISLKGADGMNHVKMLTEKQLEAFAHTFELYRAMGGKF